MSSILIDGSDCCTSPIHFDGLVEVFGTVHADIVCKELLIASSGVVRGNVVTEKIVIKDGGILYGMLRMPKEEE